jgi:hypothetical protein
MKDRINQVKSDSKIGANEFNPASIADELSETTAHRKNVEALIALETETTVSYLFSSDNFCLDIGPANMFALCSSS